MHRPVSLRPLVVAVLAGAALAAVPAAAAGAEPPVAPTPAPVIAAGVAIDGLPVAGLTRSDARVALLAQRVAPARKPLPVAYNSARFAIQPARIGYRADIDYALDVALLYGASRPVPEGGVNVSLRERVNGKRLRALLSARSARHAKRPRNAGLRITRAGFTVVKPKIGRSMRIARAERLVERAILGVRPQGILRLPTKRVRPARTAAGPGVLVNRDTFTLSLFRAGKVRRFPIAVGQVGHSTPGGLWHVVNKQLNPWWRPPDAPWAEGLEPVPPGPNNPLGTRWIGLSASLIGIHGTPSSGSIGSRASHGCIRMGIGDAEFLFNQVDLGTPVLIV
jgi:hypothetical protein